MKERWILTGTQKEKTNKSWTVWFSSDQHFGHESIINFCDRPFKTVEEMNEALIANWNKAVKPEDLCIFVGDVFFKCNTEQIKNILSRLNGNRKILVFGNHDRDRRRMMNLGFTLVVEEMSMDIAGEKVLISHYPFQMKKKLYAWVKFKRNVIRYLNGLGFKIRPTYLEKYHERRPEDNGQFLIHGHTHDKTKVDGRAIHVGVDAWKFKPVNILEVGNAINEIKRNGPKYIEYRSKRENKED
jgi:calcineurin-like phosphoesterase family protein